MIEDTLEKIKPMDKLLRGRMKMTELSRATGIGYSTLGSYNLGTREPSLANAVAIARALNCSLVEVAEAFGYEVKGLPYA